MPKKDAADIRVPSLGRVAHGRPPGSGGRNRFAPQEKPRDIRVILRRLLRFYFKEGRALFIVLALLLADTGLVILGPYFIGKSITAMLDGDGMVNVFCLILVSIYVTDWVLSVAQGVIMTAASQKIVRDLRRALFDKLQRLPLSYHDEHTHGELMSRLTNDVDNISVTIAHSTTQLAGAAVTLVGSFVMMALLNIYLTLAVLATVPMVLLLTRMIAGHSRKLFFEQQTELGRLNGIIEETFSGSRTVKAFNMEEAVISKFSVTNARLRHSALRAQMLSGMLMPFMNVITNIGYVLVSLTGGILVVKGMAAVGTVASFAAYSRQFTHPLNSIAGMFNNLQSALAGAERVFELLDESEEPPDEDDARETGKLRGAVCFEDVTFAYTSGVNVLNQVSFSVDAGQKVALVGPTGAGKTTIVNLLTRFYDATGGTIYIDGIDIRKYKRDSLREAFSVVLQDTCLFTGTIADNIRYGRPEATDDEVKEAAVVSGAHDFISRLKDGYNTRVSGEAESLSQGQRQLLAISRAVLCRAPILILDEATSSVDTRNELRIQDAMLRLSSGCTSFVIAHRLSTVRNADIIMVVRDGRIAESGSHDELLVSGGLYAQMYESQYGN